MASDSAPKRVMRKDLYDLSKEWTHEEEATLERLLPQYEQLPRLACFARIALQLKDKSVRDIAFRVRRMKIIENGKRRRDDDVELARKGKDKQVKVHDHATMLPSQGVMPSHPSPQNLGAMPSGAHPMVASPMSTISCATAPANDVIKELFDKNEKIMKKITMNVASDELHSNIVLFEQIKENMVKITHEMNNRGVMNEFSLLSIQPNEIRIPPTPAHYNDVFTDLQAPHQSRMNSPSIAFQSASRALAESNPSMSKVIPLD